MRRLKCGEVGVVALKKLRQHLLNASIILSLLWTFFVTLSRGYQDPLMWAKAHWLVSYQDFGFVKRGLFGTIMKRVLFLDDIHSSIDRRIEMFSTAFLAGLYAALFWAIWRILKRTNFSASSILCAALFLSSPYVVMTGHLNGYFDIQIVLLCVGALYAVLKGHFFIASVVLSTSLLIHETTLCLSFPLAIFAAFLVLYQDRDKHDSKNRYLIASLFRLSSFLLPVLFFALIYAYQNTVLDPRELKEGLKNYFSQFGFIGNGEVRAVSTAYTRSFTHYVRTVFPTILDRIFMKTHLTQSLPILLLLLVYARNIVTRFELPRWAFGFAVIVTFLPISLHGVAWDVSRIWTYPTITAMLSVWVLHEISSTTPSRVCVVGQREASDLFFSVAALVGVTLNMFTQVPLMVNRVDQYDHEQRIMLYLPVLLIFSFYVVKQEQIVLNDTENSAIDELTK